MEHRIRRIGERMKKGLVRGAAVLTACLMLAGCGGHYSLKDTGILVHKDGSVESAIYEDFDTNQFSIDALKSFAEQEVITYNQAEAGLSYAYADDEELETLENAELSAWINEVSEEDGKAILKMSYASGEDYVAFNDAEGNYTVLTCGTVSQASEQGVNLSGFVFHSEKEEDVPATALRDKWYYVYLQGAGQITVEGRICYLSDGLTMAEDSKSMAVSESAESPVCIIFK